MPQTEALISLFAEIFAQSERTVLVRGTHEPVYRPWTTEHPYAEIVFAHGFFSSALHEIAHWCIAGQARRRLPDYGYWYQPDGRSTELQREFESVEVKPQALEWIFSVAAGTTFHFSADNLASGGVEASPAWRVFQESVARQARAYVTHGLPTRAQRFATEVNLRFGSNQAWRESETYTLDPMSSHS